MTTKWKKHKREWKGCQKCLIGHFAHKHCLGRGTLPADLLFVGEAPGRTEDLSGTVFDGNAGKVLDRIIEEAGLNHVRTGTTYFITNIIACRPTDKVGGYNRAPEPEEIESCSPRVTEIYHIAHPRAIITLGYTARHHFPYEKDRLANYHIYHPAYLLRTIKPGEIYNHDLFWIAVEVIRAAADRLKGLNHGKTNWRNGASAKTSS